MYPPLIRCLKIELCAETKLQDRVIATECIYLDDISDPITTNGCLPSYGPAYIDLYDEPYLLHLKKKPKIADYIENKPIIEDENDQNDQTTNKLNIPLSQQSPNKLNDTINNSICSLVSFSGSGDSRYVGRMLLHIESSKFYKNKNEILSNNNSDIHVDFKKSNKLYAKREFILFACLSDVSMIDQRYSKSQLSFRLSIGHDGCNINDIQSNSTKTYKPIQLAKNMPYFLVFEKKKPCLSLYFELEDTSHILFKNNYINKKIKKMVSLN